MIRSARIRSATRTFIRPVITSAAGLALLMSSACADGDSNPEASSGDLKTVRIYGSPVPHDAALFMAQQQGFFEKHGLKADIQNFPSGTTALETFKQGIDGKEGFGDVIVSGGFPSLTFWDQTAGEYQVLAAVEQDSEGYVLMARTGINNPQDLAGKKIGYREGSTSEFFARTYFEKNGMSFDDDVEAVNLDQAAMIAALERGDIDAFFLFEPSGRLATAASGDKVHYLATGEGYINGTTVVGTWKSQIENNSEVLQSVLRALIDGEAYATEHPDEVAALYQDKFNIAVEGTLEDLKAMRFETTIDQSFIDASEVQAAALQTWGKLGDFDVWKYIDPCVLHAVAPEAVVDGAPTC